MVLHSDKGQTVVILGLGYVGLTLAVVMAERGFRVVGVEIQERVVELTNRGIPHFFETQMEQRLKEVVDKGKLVACNEIPNNIDADIYVITVGTPLSESGSVRLDMLKNATNEIAMHMSDSSLVILRSTVKIGVTKNIVCPILEKTKKKFHLAFCPERTLEGNALEELVVLPQIIGGIDEASSWSATQVFQKITSTIIRVSNVETAEITKLVDNTSRDVMFAYANEISMLCDVVGANMMEVVQAGKKGYPRTNIPLPGLVGGPCLSKDSYILDQSVSTYEVRPNIIMASRKTNEDQPAYVANFLMQLANMLKWKDNIKISLLGLAFKGRPATDDLRGTMAIPVFNALKNVFPNATYCGFDVLVSQTDTEEMGLIYTNSIDHALEDAHLVLILNNHPTFEHFSVSQQTHLMSKPGVVYDFWNTMDIDNTNFTDGVYYFATGSHKLCTNLMGEQ
jgi:nucleotide sugar dehydrogenase